jgi:hypothetical protein
VILPIAFAVLALVSADQAQAVVRACIVDAGGPNRLCGTERYLDKVRRIYSGQASVESLFVGDGADPALDCKVDGRHHVTLAPDGTFERIPTAGDSRFNTSVAKANASSTLAPATFSEIQRGCWAGACSQDV